MKRGRCPHEAALRAMKHLLRKYEAGLTPYEALANARIKQSVPYRAVGTLH